VGPHASVDSRSCVPHASVDSRIWVATTLGGLWICVSESDRAIPLRSFNQDRAIPRSVELHLGSGNPATELHPCHLPRWALEMPPASVGSGDGYATYNIIRSMADDGSHANKDGIHFNLSSQHTLPPKPQQAHPYDICPPTRYSISVHATMAYSICTR
jgi:hypothetical protein